MHERKKILWLVSWYPNKYDPFDGDFIQRHATAAALLNDVHVLFINQWHGQKEIESSLSEINGLREERIYLPKHQGITGKLQNYREWKHHFRARVKEIIKTQGPALIHVHVPWKVGLIAVWAKKHFGIPYVVTEHWGIYNEFAKDNIYTKPFLVRSLLKKIYSQARSFVPVSRFLGEAVNLTLVKKSFTVIPNVVDTTLFRLSSNKNSTFTFIHISTMADGKNVGGILNAYRRFLETTTISTQFVFIGNKDDRYVQRAKSLRLLESVFFKGEISYSDVARELQKAHCHVLFSKSETFSCVTAEALCCGVPVIAPQVGALPELVNNNSGYLINSNNEEELLKAMHEIVKNYQKFNLAGIASAASQQYNYPVVAEKFDRLYSSIT